MKVMRTSSVAGLALLGAVALNGCGSDNGAKSNTGSSSKASGGCASGSISGAGSTFQQNMEQQWSKDYAAKCSGAQVNYQSVGSGAGIEQFGSGTVDFAGSDVVMKDTEQSKADATCGSPAWHIPVTAGGVALEYNLPGVDALNLSATTIAGIFQGTIKTWSDPAIKADNPSAKLPATTISGVHRSDGSGTTSVLSSFLDANAKSWKLGTGKELMWPGGQAAKGSDGVTATVKQTKGAIGYAEISFAKANSLSVAKVRGAGADFVELTGDTVSKAIDSFQSTGTGNNLAGTVDYTKITHGYPISTVSYVIVCSKPKDAAKLKVLKGYVSYAVTDGQQAAAGLGFAPLPQSLADKAKAAAAAIGS